MTVKEAKLFLHKYYRLSFAITKVYGTATLHQDDIIDYFTQYVFRAFGYVR